MCVCEFVCACLFVGTAEYGFNITLYSALRIDHYRLCQLPSRLPDLQCFVICFQLKIFMCSILLTAKWNYIKVLIPQIKHFVSTDRTRTDFYFMKCVILYIDEPTLTDIMLKEIPSCTAQQRTDS